MIYIIKWAVVETFIYSVRVKTRISRFRLFKKIIDIYLSSLRSFSKVKSDFSSLLRHTYLQSATTLTSHIVTQRPPCTLLYLIIIVMNYYYLSIRFRYNCQK